MVGGNQRDQSRSKEVGGSNQGLRGNERILSGSKE